MDHKIEIGRIRQQLRVVSKSLFGKLYRLEVIAAIGATRDPIWSRGMAQALHLPENQVSAELKTLAKLGALHDFPSQHDRRKLYQLAPHPLWIFVRTLLKEAVVDLYPDRAAEVLEAYWSEFGDVDGPRPVLPRERLTK